MCTKESCLVPVPTVHYKSPFPAKFWSRRNNSGYKETKSFLMSLQHPLLTNLNNCPKKEKKGWVDLELTGNLEHQVHAQTRPVPLDWLPGKLSAPLIHTWPVPLLPTGMCSSCSLWWGPFPVTPTVVQTVHLLQWLPWLSTADLHICSFSTKMQAPQVQEFVLFYLFTLLYTAVD